MEETYTLTFIYTTEKSMSLNPVTQRHWGEVCLMKFKEIWLYTPKLICWYDKQAHVYKGHEPHVAKYHTHLLSRYFNRHGKTDCSGCCVCGCCFRAVSGRWSQVSTQLTTQPFPATAPQQTWQLLHHSRQCPYICFLH